jgi:predicted enzyme related to lactoylglutathione lyase
MAKRTKYAPGTFSWTDLTTTDQDAAKKFYGELFGWQATDQPIGEGAVYSMMSVEGSDVAAISTQPEVQRNAGVPPLWNSYVTVESADAAVEKATELGATVHAPAFDVFDAGRMAVIQDPQGAHIFVWQPNQHIGASLVNAPGALCWNELASPDVEGSSAFYGPLFDWTLKPMEGSEMPYEMIWTAANAMNGGIRPKMEMEPSYWLVYFGTADVDASLAKAVELGGSAIVEPMDIPPGRFAVVADPQGAVFALFQGDFDE